MCYTFHVSHHLFQPNFFVLNLISWFGALSNEFIIFWYSIILLLYYYINRRSSITFCLFSAYQITCCLCRFLNYCFWSSFECICCKLLSKIMRFPSQQILVPRASRGHPSPKSTGCSLKNLFDDPGNVPIRNPRDVPKWSPGAS